MRTWFAFFVVVCVVSWGCCFAGVPQKMNYQGKLTDAGGKLVADGSYEMKVSIYNAETDGDQRWTETWDESNGRVQVTNGLFNVILGTHNSINIVFDENYWLELQVKGVGGYEPLLPRQQIVSSAYSFRAEKANEADRAVEADGVKDGAITSEKLNVSGIDPLTGKVTFPAPTVDSINPSSKNEGYPSFSATITGQNFQSASQGRIGSANLTGEEVSSSTSMTANVPSGISAGTHDVSVSNLELDWGTKSGGFTVVGYTPTPTPTITPTITQTPTPTITPYGVYASCKAILTATPSAGDGTYTIDPDGPTGNAPFSVYCDMTTDNGGWTLAAFRGSSVKSANVFSINGSVRSDFAEAQATGDWSINICNNKINGGADYIEMVVTGQDNNGSPSSHRISDFNRQRWFKLNGGYTIQANWATANEVGSVRTKCRVADTYSDLYSGWNNNELDLWLPNSAAYPAGFVYFNTTDNGMYWFGNCGEGSYSWNTHSAYFWVR